MVRVPNQDAIEAAGALSYSHGKFRFNDGKLNKGRPVPLPSGARWS